jgi:hypothetical protein
MSPKGKKRLEPRPAGKALDFEPAHEFEIYAASDHLSEIEKEANHRPKCTPPVTERKVADTSLQQKTRPNERAICSTHFVALQTTISPPPADGARDIPSQPVQHLVRGVQFFNFLQNVGWYLVGVSFRKASPKPLHKDFRVSWKLDWMH